MLKAVLIYYLRLVSGNAMELYKSLTNANRTVLSKKEMNPPRFKAMWIVMIWNIVWYGRCTYTYCEHAVEYITLRKQRQDMENWQEALLSNWSWVVYGGAIEHGIVNDNVYLHSFVVWEVLHVRMSFFSWLKSHLLLFVLYGSLFLQISVPSVIICQQDAQGDKQTCS